MSGRVVEWESCAVDIVTDVPEEELLETMPKLDPNAGGCLGVEVVVIMWVSRDYLAQITLAPGNMLKIFPSFQVRTKNLSPLMKSSTQVDF